MSKNPQTHLEIQLAFLRKSDLGVPMVRHFLISCLFMLLTQPAFAEKADKDKPIEIEADTVTVNDAKKISIYTGNVIVTQGTLLIHADKLVVREDLEGFQHSSSYGNPTTFKQKREGKDEISHNGDSNW